MHDQWPHGALRRRVWTRLATLSHWVGPASLGFLLLCPALPLASAQSATPGPELSFPPMHWAETAVAAEIRIMDFDPHQALRYKVEKVDAKGRVLRQVIESREGTVARLLERDGQPLTREEDTAERQRLQAILDRPADFLRHVKREEGSRVYATELLHAMPGSMIWSYAPGQPQLPGAKGNAIVLDFKPDPHFRPPSLVTEGLTGVTGRVWIDRDTGCVTRIEGKILHPVDFGWGGVLARIREGGTIALEQQRASNGRWLFSRLVEHLSVREILVHTVQEDADMRATDVNPLAAPLSFRDAVQQLLAMPVAVR